ncbi:MAG: helix-hairpin-helix domain-containing protein, partial [Dethiobacteria bacterium]
ATDPALKILQQVRDEAHRFALSLSRDLNVKNSLASILMKVPGIGPTRSKALLKHFGSLERLRKASLEELTAVPSMNELSARNLYKEFHDEAGL